MIPTELPDSLDDSAIIAATSCTQFYNDAGPTNRCRVDFDTSIGDETYTTLKSSTEFMQKFVTALCYDFVPGMQEMRQKEMMALVQARTELLQMNNDGGDDDTMSAEEKNAKKQQLMRTIQCGGRTPTVNPDKPDEFLPYKYEGPKLRIYFPDEGSAALARRDWNPTSPNAEENIVPPCVEFSSCGGVQMQDTSDDVLIMFFCPKASEAEFVEEILIQSEEKLAEQLKLSVFVNPLLVDMGVTGFGMAGRMLRERLIDQLTPTYYLRTLAWGALTRKYPDQFTVWQEDAECDGGYRMIKSLTRLPSNPEVEDIYDYENGNASDPSQQQGFGLLNGIADFVNGMTRL